MDAVATQRQELRAVSRMIPEQIISGEILQLPRLELERRLIAEFEQNPALTLDEAGRCPACGEPVTGFPCPACGHRPSAEEDVPVVMAEDWETYRERLHDGQSPEPFGTVAARRTMRDDLRSQWRLEAPDGDSDLGLYLIECLDADGYLREPLIEVAERFRRSVPQVEAVLACVQRLEPAGIAARDLRECLLLQCVRAGRSDVSALAERVVREAWEHLEGRRTDRVAAILGARPEDVSSALEWMRDHLAPCPGRAYADPWSHLSPREEPEVAPDVVIRVDGDGFRVEIVETSRFRLGLDPLYHRLENQARRAAQGGADAEHVRRTVASARWLIDAIAQRRRTLHRVMTAVAEAQSGYLRHGRSHLQPLMQKTIAARIGVHESTVCRALADKLVRLPSGETVPTTAFFDASAPVKEVLLDLIGREDPAHPLSDSRLASLLEASGYKVARRTVAKYRESMRVPPVETRQRSFPR